jgi:fatty acid desaturase
MGESADRTHFGRYWECHDLFHAETRDQVNSAARSASSGLRYLLPGEIGTLEPPILSADELREVLCTRNALPLFHFALTALLVFVPPLAIYALPSVWIAIFCVLLNIHTFNRCAQIVHMSDHTCLFADKRYDIVVGQISGFFVGYLQRGHKEAHNEHHLYLNSAKDPDRIWCQPEARVGSILRGWLRDLFLVSACVRFSQYIPGTHGKSRAAGQPSQTRGITGLVALGVSFLPVALVQFVVALAYVAAAGFTVTRGLEYYLLIYILPLFVLYPLQIRLRSNVEHSYVPGYRAINPEDVGIVRSVRPHWIEKLIVAPLNYEYHFEHHLFPTMPYYNAPALRRILDAKGYAIPLAHGYISFIWRKWRAERDLDRRARPAS